MYVIVASRVGRGALTLDAHKGGPAVAMDPAVSVYVAVVFGLTWLLVAPAAWPWLPLGRPGGALVGAVLMVVGGGLSVDAAIAAIADRLEVRPASLATACSWWQPHSHPLALRLGHGHRGWCCCLG
jgi:hypothetical protein